MLRTLTSRKKPLRTNRKTDLTHEYVKLDGGGAPSGEGREDEVEEEEEEEDTGLLISTFALSGALDDSEPPLLDMVGEKERWRWVCCC